MMAKYSTFAFIYFVALSTLFVPQVRRCYRQPQFYLAVAIWLALVLPNVFWLWNHDFAAFKWVDSQIKMQLNLDMLQSLLLVFYPSLVLWAILRRSGAVLAGHRRCRCGCCCGSICCRSALSLSGSPSTSAAG